MGVYGFHGCLWMTGVYGFLSVYECLLVFMGFYVCFWVSMSVYGFPSVYGCLLESMGFWVPMDARVVNNALFF